MLVWKAELLWIKNMSTVKKRYIMLSNKRIENLTELTSDDAHISQNFIEIIQYDSDLHQVIKVVHRILNI